MSDTYWKTVNIFVYLLLYCAFRFVLAHILSFLQSFYRNGLFIVQQYLIFFQFYTGDDGYTLEPWLMTPLKHEVPNTPRFRYNDDLCSARCCVERLFGVWKAVFRCLSAERRLVYEPGVAGRIVNACAVLQNMRIAHRVQDVDFDDIEVQNFHHANRRDIAVEDDDRGQAYQGRALALRIQERFIARQYGIM